MRKFSHTKPQRKALLKSLAQGLILHGRIKTTLAKAKELRPFIEKKITKAKIDNLATRRYLNRFFTKKAVDKLINDYGKIFFERPGGYTRIIKLPPRQNDSADMAIIELIKSNNKNKK